MTHPGRRLSERRRLARPVEAELLLCGGQTAKGWIVDEHEEGLGMAFGAEDVPCLMGHVSCCVGTSVDLWLGADRRRGRPVPVRLAHLTRHGESLVCRAGLAFDVSRMRSEDVAHLLTVWRSLMAPSP